METIVCTDRFPRPGSRHVDYLALRGVPVTLAHRRFVKVMLKIYAVILTLDSQIKGRICSKQACCRSYSKDKDKEALFNVAFFLNRQHKLCRAFSAT